MRILSLNLKAFGHFTNRSLDFSQGSEGLHIIYGSNEAGKSTALRGLKSLLFGVPERTTDNFLHDNHKMRIGGIMRNAKGDILEFERRKGRTKTLLDSSGNALDDGVLERFLGAIGEDLFSRMFAISHDDLVQAGKEIAAGGGDLGGSLFAAGMGIASVRKVLETLESEADVLFRAQAKTRTINTLISKYNEAKQSCSRDALSASEWEEHERLLRKARTEKETLLPKLFGLRTEHSRLVRITDALPVIAELRQLTSELEELGEVFILEPTFAQEWSVAENKLDQAVVDEQRALDALEAAESSLKRLSIDDDLLSQEQVVQNLYQRLGSHFKAVEDRIRLKGELMQLYASAESMLKELDLGLTLEKINTIRLSLPQKQQIRKLSTDLGSMNHARDDAHRRTQVLASQIKERTNEISVLGTSIDVSELRTLMRSVQGESSLEARLGEVQSDFRLTIKEAEVNLKKLPNWSGSLKELETIAIPSIETIDRYEKDIDDTKFQINTIDGRLAELARKISELDKSIQTLQIAGEVPTETELFSAREYRQQGWELIKKVWLDQQDDATSAQEYTKGIPLYEAYEKGVHAADNISDRLRRESERVAMKAAYIAEKEQGLKEQEEQRLKREETGQKLSGLVKEWEELWVQQGVKPVTPKEMRSWVQRRETLLQVAQNIRSFEAKAGLIEGRITELKHILSRMLQQFGETGEFASLSLLEFFTRGQTFIDVVDKTNNKRAALQKGLQDLEQQLADAELDEQQFTAQLADWSEDWKEITKDLLFLSSEDPTIVHMLLDKVEEITKTVDKAAALDGRINGITEDEKQFTEDVHKFTSRFVQDLASLPVEHAVAEINARLMQTKNDSAVRTQILHQRGKDEAALRKAQQAKNEMQRRIEALRSKAKCEANDNMDLVIQKSESARRLDTAIAQRKQQLLTYTAGATIDEFVTEVASIVHDELEGRIKDLFVEIDDAEKRISELDQTIGSEKAALETMDGSSKSAETAEALQSTIAQIKYESEKYICLVLARVVLKTEVERYREVNKGPVLSRASEYFSLMTKGAFAGLKTDFDADDRPILMGVRPSGQEVTVREMSDGACDQLYLSLKLASLEHHLESNESLPFIVDDILINFDDDRAQATLEALAELSSKMQIIFFTHHQHLVELAQSIALKDRCCMHFL